MAEKKFSVGDVVRLKSGGPKMTVSNRRNSAEEEKMDTLYVRCEWFAQRVAHHERFPEATLLPVPGFVRPEPMKAH